MLYRVLLHGLRSTSCSLLLFTFYIASQLFCCQVCSTHWHQQNPKVHLSTLHGNFTLFRQLFTCVALVDTIYNPVIETLVHCIDLFRNSS